jgi:hypothetical protein
MHAPIGSRSQASLTATAFALLASALALPAQDQRDQRPTALVNARILTMTEAGTIPLGTVLIRDGKIEAVGADVRPPLGARVIDVKGGTVMPGLVHAWSGAGLAGAPRPAPGPVQDGGRRGGRGRGARPEAGPAQGGGNRAASRVAEGLYERQDVFHDLLETGITSLSVRPLAPGFPGLAARLEPDGTTHSSLVADAEGYLVIAPATNTPGKKLVKDEFDKAKQALEARKAPRAPAGDAKPSEAAQPATQKPDAPKPDAPKPEEPKPEPPKPEPPKPEPPKPEPPKPEPPKEAPAAEAKPAGQPAPPRPEAKKDPNVEVLADLVDGKRKAFVRLGSAMELQHWLEAIGDLRFPMVLVADNQDARRGRLDECLADLKKLDAAVLMTPRLAELPFTRTLVNVPKRLHDAGITLGFVLPDDAANARNLRSSLMELVRCGLPEDVALRAVTVVPAKMLGIDATTGSIAAGKRADLLVFDADPLDPVATLRQVFLRGHEVVEGPTR